MSQSTEVKSKTHAKIYTVMGSTGKVGGHVVKYLKSLTSSTSSTAPSIHIRAIIRDSSKSESVIKAGATSTSIAHFDDSKSLTAAFNGSEAIFAMLMPPHDTTSEFKEWTAANGPMMSLINALKVTTPAPKRVVFLSSVGAQATQPNVLQQFGIIEKKMREELSSTIPLAFVRPGWFMENVLWDLPSALSTGVVESFVHESIPMTACDDIGRVIAEHMLSSITPEWTGVKVVEVAAAHRYNPSVDYAPLLSAALNKNVKYVVVPRDQWAEKRKAGGFKNPEMCMAMNDGCNEGWICFEGPANSIVKGRVDLDTVVQQCVAKMTSAK